MASNGKELEMDFDRKQLRRVEPGLYRYQHGDQTFEIRRDREPSYRPVWIDGKERIGRETCWWAVREIGVSWNHGNFEVEGGLRTYREAVESLRDWIDNFGAGRRPNG